DLTMEAWLNPTQSTTMARVVQHESDASRYALGLHLAPNSFHFNGITDSALIKSTPDLDITGVITLEAWIKPEKTDGFRYAFGHGYVLDPAGEVVLRVQDGRYYAGAYDGKDHGVGMAMPGIDAGTWVHLAGVYDGSTWTLYRNGEVAATAPDPVGAV